MGGVDEVVGPGMTVGGGASGALDKEAPPEGALVGAVGIPGLTQKQSEP